MRRLDRYTIGIHTPQLQKQYLHAFKKVLHRGIFLRGPENKKLTSLLSAYFKSPLTPVASGHDALLLSIRSLRLQASDEIIIPANAYPTAFAAAQSGVTLRLADVEANGQLSLDSLKRVINHNTKAVIMVHLFGNTGDIDAIRSICTKNNITFIEDCAQAFGTTYKKTLVGTIGDFGCFSFYPTKNLGSFGDGGAILTHNKSRMADITKQTLYGETNRYHSTLIAGHSNLPELQAAGLIISFKRIKKTILKKQRIASWYRQTIKTLSTPITPLSSNINSAPAPHLFVVRVKHRDALQRYLAKSNIQTQIHYPIPVHRVPSFAYLNYPIGSFPNAESLAKEIVSLPFYESMTKTDVVRIVYSINKFYKLR